MSIAPLTPTPVSMSNDPKDNESFFRKVVRFVANPTTDWHELNSQVMDPRESEYAKSELKAMIERKRRNDFVRKREFDMLRKIRREGIHAKGLADHPPTSQLDDPQSQPARTDGQAEEVRHKIDAIEKQMVGESSLASRRRLPPYPGRPGPAAAAVWWASSSASRHAICCARKAAGMRVLLSARSGAPRNSHRYAARLSGSRRR